MKKFLLLAFAACLTFAAQAVTMSWDSSEGSFNGFKDANGNAVSWSGTFSITLNFTATSTPETVFQLLTANGANKAGELRFYSTQWSGNTADFGTYNRDGNAAWMETNGDFSSARVESSDGTKSNTLKLTFNGYNAENKTYESVTYDIIFANGDNQTYTMHKNQWSDGIGFGLDELSWTSVVTGEGVTMNSMTLEADKVTTSVPEPTALALLALGVAGLAVRRKA